MTQSRDSNLSDLLDSLVKAHPSPVIRSGSAFAEGLRKDALESLLKHAALPLNETAQEYFAWSNGYIRDGKSTIDQLSLFTPFMPLALDEALQFLQENSVRDDWKPHLLPVANDGYGGFLKLDCSKIDSNKVYIFDPDLGGTYALSNSLQSLVEFQIGCITEGIIYSDGTVHVEFDIEKYYAFGMKCFPDIEYWKIVSE